MIESDAIRHGGDPSDDRRGNSPGAGRQVGVPAADVAPVPDRRAGELERILVRVWAGDEVVPVEDVLAELASHLAGAGASVAAANPSGAGNA